MLDWLNLGNKKYPEFWKEYLSSFSTKTNRIVVIKLQASVSKVSNDSIISIAAIGIKDNAVIIADSFEATIAHRKLIENNEDSKQISNISFKDQVTEALALETFIKYVKNANIIGYRVDIEMELLNTALGKNGLGKLRNEALDIEIMYRKWKELSESNQVTIPQLQHEFKLTKSDESSTIEAAFDLALIFLKLKIPLGL